MSDSDNQLMLLIQEGDRKAFRTLFQRHMRPMHHFVCRFVGNPSVAEELTQEIFYKLYRAAPSYEPRGKFTTYLYRVATNHCLNEVRRADYQKKFDSLEQGKFDDGMGGMELPDTQLAPADALYWAQTMAEKLQEFLDELPSNQRAALLLHRLEAMPYKDIAETLEVSVGAVKSLLHRARETLRRKLEQWNQQCAPSERASPEVAQGW